MATDYRRGIESGRGYAPKVQRNGSDPGQVPGRGEGRRNSEDEQEQGKTSQQLVIPAQGGLNEGAPASSMELDPPRVRGARGARGGAGSSGTAKDRKRSRSNTPRSGLSMEEEPSLADS